MRTPCTGRHGLAYLPLLGGVALVGLAFAAGFFASRSGGGGSTASDGALVYAVPLSVSTATISASPKPKTFFTKTAALISGTFQDMLGGSKKAPIAVIPLTPRNESPPDPLAQGGEDASIAEEKKKDGEEFQKKCQIRKFQDPDRRVQINEIAWMGSLPEGKETAASAAKDEWIELRSNVEEKIPLGGWELLSANSAIHFVFPEDAEISPKGYFLLVRGERAAIGDKKADYSYSGTMSNKGAWLELLDANCNVVDDVDASSGWMAGESAKKYTMERNAGDLRWYTSAYAGGTPRAENSPPGGFGFKGGSVGAMSAAGNPSSQNTSVQSQSPTPPPAAASARVLICEIQTAGTDNAHEEFLELCNPTASDISLEGWYVQKKTKSAKNFSTFAGKALFAGKSIAPHGYFVVAYPDSGIKAEITTDYGLSDDNTVALKDSDGNIVDKVGWGEAGDCAVSCAPSPSTGQSIARKIAGDSFVNSGNNAADFELRGCPSPGAAAVVCSAIVTTPAPVASPTPAPSASPIVSPTPTPPPIGGPTPTPSLAGEPTSTPTPTPTSSAVLRILIKEVQITGGAGKTDNDFIRIFNDSDTAANVSGWKLRKRTASGSESSIKVFDSGTMVPARSEYVWANSGNGFAASINAHISSTQTLADNNSVALEQADGTIIDALAWGIGLTNPFAEGSPFPQNPAVGQKIQRKDNGGLLKDTNDNSADFELR